jgi:hemoglobin
MSATHAAMRRAARRTHRGEDGLRHEEQLLIDLLCAGTGGPMYGRGRDMELRHRGMRTTESDWSEEP